MGQLLKDFKNLNKELNKTMDNLCKTIEKTFDSDNETRFVNYGVIINNSFDILLPFNGYFGSNFDNVANIKINGVLIIIEYNYINEISEDDMTDADMLKFDNDILKYVKKKLKDI